MRQSHLNDADYLKALPKLACSWRNHDLYGLESSRCPSKSWKFDLINLQGLSFAGFPYSNPVFLCCGLNQGVRALQICLEKWGFSLEERTNTSKSRKYPIPTNPSVCV